MASVKEVEQLVNRLSAEEQLQLVRKLEQATWAKRLDTVVFRIRQRAPKLSQARVQWLCRDVRRERTERARRP